MRNWYIYLIIPFDICFVYLLPNLCLLSEQPVLPVGSVHINQLIAKRKAEKEGRELITDKWRLVVSNSRVTVEIDAQYQWRL